jgi:hypothetical protein
VFEAALASLPIDLDWLDIVLAAGHRPAFEELILALRSPLHPPVRPATHRRGGAAGDERR